MVIRQATGVKEVMLGLKKNLDLHLYLFNNIHATSQSTQLAFVLPPSCLEERGPNSLHPYPMAE